MANEQTDRLLIWELESQSQAGEGKENRLQLWRRDDGAFMFLAENRSAETVTPFYIEHPQQIQHLITAGVFVLNNLAHVPPSMPEGLDADDEIVLTYFNGHQLQTEAGQVIDWAIISQYMVLATGQVVHLRGGIPVGTE